MKHIEERYMALIALFAACLIAAHSAGGSPAAFLGTYFYWLVRIGAESLLFFGVRSNIESYAPKSLSQTTVTILAILVSHLPFVLSVTAMDIVLGFPELGITGSKSGERSRMTELALEMIYLFDNHVALCLLLTVPRLVQRSLSTQPLPQEGGTKGTLLSAIDPALNGDILWVEAQEHYVRITTQHENRMVLARFSDIVRELSQTDGLQVHRSHWVANSAIVKEQKNGQSLTLLLSTGDNVPVSRSFKSKLAAMRNDEA
ncbi:MAG: LytTR family transcriptional regulator [Alphaproteobacteria bacterium]|nr:LytTR family transcriptional regulator [Alphaproteobacteria bacterium]